jgi:hypothetical protein
MKEIAAILSLLSSYVPNPDQPWLSPLAQSFVLQQYLAPQSEYSAGHRGIDLNAVIDELVFAPESGEITFVGKVGYRQVLTLETTLGAITFEPVCSDLLVGSQIIRGDVIGTVCQPDSEYVWHCDIACIHLGLKTERGYLSPEAYIFGMSPTRLLP